MLDIYLTYKEDFRLALLDSLDVDSGIRKFTHDYYVCAVKWCLENPQKHKFILTYAHYPHVEDCMKNVSLEKYDFIIDKLEKAIKEEEIVAENITYLLYLLTGSIDTAVKYLNSIDQKNKDKIIEKSFMQFWRSIVNF